MTGAELVVEYATRSAVRRHGPGSELLLATSGGCTEAGPAVAPWFFSGFLTEPAVAAAGMLACAAVARARYHLSGPAIRLLRDPVVTSNGDRLRFESFSSCGGVHARLDLLPAALADPPLASGTTNVDFNEAMRAALGDAAITGPLLLSVGSQEVTAETARGSATERKVPLPARWLRGFGEVQALAQDFRPLGELTGAQIRRFIQSLPRGARRPLWAMSAGNSFALSVTSRPGAACIAGPHRLAQLGPLLRFARRLLVYGPDTEATAAPSAWELDLGSARFTLTLSPEPYRGFSGEGALLELLAADDAAADAAVVGAALDWDPRIDIARLAVCCALPPERVTVALGYLAASGRVGYDLAEAAFFHRELPFGAAAEAMHPRLASARKLIASGAVLLVDGGALVGGIDARHGPAEPDTASHRVTFGASADRCTCPWWGKHQGSRGPCKHVLAARMAAR